MHTKESRAKALAKIHLRKKLWLQKNGPCISCGSWEDLEIDHIKPTEKKSNSVWSWKEEKMLTELAKCRILCSTCHKLRHRWYNFAKRTKHGTENMYRKFKCRCLKCKNEHNRIGRLRKINSWRSCYK